MEDTTLTLVLPSYVMERLEAAAAAEGMTPRHWAARALRAAVPQDDWWVVVAHDGGEYPPWGEGGGPKEQISMRLSERGERVVRRAFDAALAAQPVEFSQFYDKTGTLLISARAPRKY